jgi:glycosyltransferase involved in cell wall biosynthesis
MQVDAITPLILTYNETSNIERVLERLTWAKRIVVIDSGSTDGTLELLKANPSVEVFFRPFDSFAAQCNFGLTQVTSEWVLSLDADYVCSPELIRELSEIAHPSNAAGFWVSFRYSVNGRLLRGTLYPPRVVLFRREGACYVNDGHAHRVIAPGSLAALKSIIIHDDRKPLDVWLRAQDRYAREEAHKLKHAQLRELSLADRLRKRMWVAPLAMPAYCLLVRGLILDGMSGIHYTLQRTYAEVLLALRLLSE